HDSHVQSASGNSFIAIGADLVWSWKNDIGFCPDPLCTLGSDAKYLFWIPVSFVHTKDGRAKLQPIAYCVHSSNFSPSCVSQHSFGLKNRVGICLAHFNCR